MNKKIIIIGSIIFLILSGIYIFSLNQTGEENIFTHEEKAVLTNTISHNFITNISRPDSVVSSAIDNKNKADTVEIYDLYIEYIITKIEINKNTNPRSYGYSSDFYIFYYKNSTFSDSIGIISIDKQCSLLSNYNIPCTIILDGTQKILYQPTKNYWEFHI